MHNNNLTGDHAIFSEIYDHVSNCSFDPLYKGSNVHFWSKFSKIHFFGQKMDPHQSGSPQTAHFTIDTMLCGHKNQKMIKKTFPVIVRI